jgi:hypothetical protein
MPNFGAGMGIEEHGNQDDEIAEEDGQNGLNPVYALGNEARGKHVGGNTDAHGHPKRGVVVGAPGGIGL